MATQTLVVQKGTVVSVNSALSIPVGTELDIVNESTVYNIYLKESLTQPGATTEDTRSLTQRDWPGAEAYVQPDSLEVWAYSPDGSVKLSVQEL